MASILTKTSDLTVIIKRSIKEISADEWDSIIGDESLYRTHRFFLSVEKANLENASYWYIMFYTNGRLTATAVCSSFRVSFDLFMSPFSQNICNFIRRKYKLFLRPKFLFCGIPVSIGKHTISISENIPEDTVIENLRLTMDQIAKQNNIKFIIFKEYSESESHKTDLLKNYNYTKAESIPRFILPVRWKSVTDYLNSMRHSYRRNILKSLNAIDGNKFSLLNQNNNKPFLNMKKLHIDDVDIFYNQYRNVMCRVKKKMEILNKSFFSELSENMGSDILNLSLENSKATYGSVLLGQNGSRLNFLLVGIDYTNRDNYHTYYNLIFGIISYAIENGYQAIDLGQTTNFVKKRYGAVGEKMYFYIKAENQIMNYILSKANKIIFPGDHTADLHVFKRSQNN